MTTTTTTDVYFFQQGIIPEHKFKSRFPTAPTPNKKINTVPTPDPALESLHTQ
jgi:hypothetical protein